MVDEERGVAKDFLTIGFSGKFFRFSVTLVQSHLGRLCLGYWNEKRFYSILVIVWTERGSSRSLPTMEYFGVLYRETLIISVSLVFVSIRKGPGKMNCFTSTRILSTVKRPILHWRTCLFSCFTKERENPRKCTLRKRGTLSDLDNL